MGSVIGYPEAHGAAATFETDISDDIKSLMVDIEPVQDLHGYDHPWPAGGGKNKLNIDESAMVTNGYDRFFPITLAAGTYSITCFGTFGNGFGAAIDLDSKIGVSGGMVKRIAPSYAFGRTQGATSSFTLTQEEADAVVSMHMRVNGAGITFADIETGKLQIELGSSTTYSPYSNICPITGWTGANITHHGKNIAQYWQQAYIGNDGSIKTGSTYAMAKPVFVQNGRPIAVSNTAGDYQGIAVFSDSSLENMIYRLANTASTYTASQDCYVVCWFNKVYSEYTELDFINRGVQIEFSYNPTDFEPYKHDEYDITFPSEAGIVYGGTLDVTNGVLTMDKYGIVVDGTNHRFVGFGDYWHIQPYDYPVIKTVSVSTQPTSVYSDITKNVNAWGTTKSGTQLFTRSSNWTGVFSSVNELNALGITVVYELATPITYQLTPQEISTIIGTNTIYADTGDISVLYPKTLTPAETVSNVSLMELRRNIMMAMQHNYIPDITTYGVEWNYSNPSTVLTRTRNAANFSNPIPAESLGSTGSSPFDNIYPWSEMKRYNIINGEVAYSEDDAGYSETDYDTVVYIPTFYYKAEKDTTNEKWNWSISGKPANGYEKHPGSGRYVGRFHTSGSSSGVFSKGGVTPLASTTRANFRTYSHNKGGNWWQIDLATWSAIQMLYLVEFANWNSQSVLGKGQNSGSVKNTGATTGSAYHTLKQTGAGGNMYRWIENPFSNLCTFADGFVASNRAVYVSTDNATFGDTTSGMNAAGITLPSNNFITGIGYSEECAWAFIPDAASGGSATTHIPDRVGSNTDVMVLSVCGSYSDKDYYGFFYFNANSNASKTYAFLGSRLIYIPTT